ncbi:MAG: glycosyltransferase [Verrucomicrobiota bacterium]
MKIAYFVYRYPTLSQTFIQREVSGLMSQGIQVEIYPLFCLPKFMRKSTPPHGHLVHYGNVLDLVLFPFKFFKEWLRQPALFSYGMRLFFGRKFVGVDAWFHSLLGLVCAINHVDQLRTGGYLLAHGAWATGPATAAAIMGSLSKIPFSFGGHAYDIYRFGGDPFLKDKLSSCAFVHTTTESNERYLKKMTARNDLKVVLARRGLPKLPDANNHRNRQSEVIRLVSVGRLVQKKGQVYQLEACKILKERSISFDLVIIGEGPLRSSLEALREKYQLEDSVHFPGAMKPEEVQSTYAKSHIFIHSGVVDQQGDRDGIPNVIPEALSHQLAVIGSMTDGVLEVIEHEITGLTVDPTQPIQIAEAVDRLANDKELCDLLGANGRAWVEKNFMADKNTQILGQAMLETRSV